MLVSQNQWFGCGGDEELEKLSRWKGDLTDARHAKENKRGDTVRIGGSASSEGRTIEPRSRLMEVYSIS